MQDLPDNFRFSQIISLLQRHGVHFIVIGGVAESLLGSPRVTYDLDICYEKTRANVEKLAAVLKDLSATLRGVPKDLRYALDAGLLWNGVNFTFETPTADFDALGYVEPIGDYGKLALSARSVDFNGVPTMVISIDDLIAIRRHLNRQKDRESLSQLLAIKRVQDEKR